MTPDTSFPIVTAPKRDSRHWAAGEVTWGELQDWVTSPARKKECGNYVLGTLEPTTVVHPGSDDECRGLHRRKSAVVTRSALTLDVDHPAADFLDTFQMVWAHAAIVHTTWNSTPEAPRYRIILPTDRDMAPDEYVIACRTIMQQFGEDQFDPSTDEAERYMFRPSARSRDVYDHLVLDGDPAPVEGLLRDFQTDLSDKPMPAPHKHKRDPFTLEGVIGLFNQVYEDWDLLIEEYSLPYEKVDDNRYHLTGSRSQAGMGPVSGVAGFVYSHHANDPAFGRTCSAFDLVRLHMFHDLDEDAKPNTPVNKLPSQDAMLELANGDSRVRELRARGDFDTPFTDASLDDLLDDDNSWRIPLDYSARSNKLKDTIQNWDLIVENDPIFRGLRYNELTMSPETGDHLLPWRPVNPMNRTISSTDRWEIVDYMEREYRLRPPRAQVDAKVDTKAGRNPFNPVKDYLLSLEWDGKPRVETCLPGVRPTPETRLIARKVMTAAVARMMEPGCKWDHALVLYGAEGIGKSWWIDRMARGFSSSLGPIDNKDTLLIMQRSWIVVSDEGHSLRKADQEAQKEFLTRTSDIFRLPYERETEVHPRHCVIWSTTNDETFLNIQEGNRRFLVVHCEDKVDFSLLTDEYIGQVWAEAVELYRAGEPLYFAPDESAAIAEKRERFVEEDALAGQIDEYLSQLVPADWWDRSVAGRLRWMEDRADGFVAEGTMPIDQTCSMQIWVEALGRRRGDHRRSDLLDITEALKRLPGWTKMDEKQRLHGYGPQTTFTREDTE